jgi:S1-C subfamily serine protease
VGWLTGGGLIAVEVEGGGPAAAAGLLVGDIVTTWEGEALGSLRELTRRLGPDAPGRTVRLGLVRAGQPLEVALTVGERRPKKGKHVAGEGA